MSPGLGTSRVNGEQGTDPLTWLLDRTVDMYANEMGLPQERPKERP